MVNSFSKWSVSYFDQYSSSSSSYNIHFDIVNILLLITLFFFLFLILQIFYNIYLSSTGGKLASPSCRASCCCSPRQFQPPVKKTPSSVKFNFTSTYNCLEFNFWLGQDLRSLLLLYRATSILHLHLSPNS